MKKMLMGIKLGIKDRIKSLPKHLFQAGLQLAVSKSHPNVEKILYDFNKGLQIIKENGAYEEAVEAFGLSGL